MLAYYLRMLQSPCSDPHIWLLLWLLERIRLVNYVLPTRVLRHKFHGLLLVMAGLMFNKSPFGFQFFLANAALEKYLTWGGSYTLMDCWQFVSRQKLHGLWWHLLVIKVSLVRLDSRFQRRMASGQITKTSFVLNEFFQITVSDIMLAWFLMLVKSGISVLTLGLIHGLRNKSGRRVTIMPTHHRQSLNNLLLMFNQIH